MTIKDLAAQTGYSVGTVSRVLNNQPNVSEKARKAILEAARASGFQLNTAAQQLKQTRSQNIIVLMKGTSNQLFASLLENIQNRMEGSPYHLVADYMDEDGNEVLRAIQLCREKKPRGLMFMGGNRRHFEADFARIDVPCVLVTNDASELPFSNLSSVCSNDDQAVRELMEGLIRMGHRKIAVIGGDRQISDTTRRRLQGCMAAFQAHGIDFDPERDYEGVRFSSIDGYKGAEALLTRSRDYTAIFCMADVMAMGAIRALSDHGFRVPEDVSVVGFDGLPIGDFTVPRLATVSQNIDLLAQRSVALLTKGIEGMTNPIHEVVSAAPLWRESAREI